MTTPLQAQAQSLPGLPISAGMIHPQHDVEQDGYTADQMRSYALAAIAAHEAEAGRLRKDAERYQMLEKIWRTGNGRGPCLVVRRYSPMFDEFEPVSDLAAALDYEIRQAAALTQGETK